MFLNLPGMGIKNPVDLTGTDDFLYDYTLAKSKEATDLKYNKVVSISSNPHENETTKLLKTLDPLNKKLECCEDCLEDAAHLLRYPFEDPVESYKDYNNLACLQFSLLDVLHNSYAIETQRIKSLLESVYPLIKINTYKYKMMEDFYNCINHLQAPHEIIYKLLIVTLVSVVDDVESCNASTITKFAINTILESLASPPSLTFCKQWMNLHKVSCIFMKDGTESIIYNYKKHKANLYILFEFHSKLQVLLKIVKLTN